jgi:Domain of unknown function (DUF5666)
MKTVAFAIFLAAAQGAAVQATEQADRGDWQKRGVEGLVRSVDPEGGTVTLTTAPRPSGNTIVIHTSAGTLFRRYGPGSAKFDTAKPCKMIDIKPGDQVRARGTRSPDGNEMIAEEVVGGAFQTIAGTITSVDAAAGTIGLTDLTIKKPLTVKITSESELRKLPPDVAQRIATRMRKPSPGPSPAEDFQRSLGTIARATVAVFQKGDVVILISTEGTNAGEVTAITMVGGVEPMLTAPGGTKAIALSPWSIGMTTVAGEN